MTADVEDNAMISDLTDCFLKQFFYVILPAVGDFKSIHLNIRKL